MFESSELDKRVSTGIEGLDEILEKGLVARRVYLVRGGPGTGKSTLGLHFLNAGANSGEKALFISLGEPESKLRKNARSIGLDLKGVSFLDLSPTSDFFSQSQSQDLFSPSEIDRGPTTEKITAEVEKLKPERVFVDSATQFRYLTSDTFQFRKQMLSLSRYLTDHGCTVILSSEGSSEAPDDDLQFLSDGVINLNFPPEGRNIRVTKFRGSDFQSGQHSMCIVEKGIKVFPRLVPDKYHRDFKADSLAFGIREMDKMLHGGLERGTSTIISGPAGVGKTTLALQFLRESAERNERAVLYSFEEGKETMLKRTDDIKLSLRPGLESGKLSIVQIEPGRYSADEFARMVMKDVENNDTRVVMLDSASGYGSSLSTADFAGHLDSLCRYLKNMGVTIILISEVESITGEFKVSETGIGFLGDNIVFLRYVEMNGELRRSIGVLKKRTSDFDKSLYEFEITRQGIKVGKVFNMMGGILGGVGLVRSLMGGG